MSKRSHSNSDKKPSKKPTSYGTQFTQRIKNSVLKTISFASPFFRWLSKNNEQIRNWLLVAFTGILALYTYRLFETSVSQTEATIHILLSSVIQTPDRRFSQIIVTADIINTSQITPAENVEIESRFDLLGKDFNDMQITYTKPIKKFPFFSGFSNMKLRDTVNVSTELFDKVGISLWPFFHMRFKYDNGFGERTITNFGFSYDINNTNESEICKHTYKE